MFQRRRCLEVLVPEADVTRMVVLQEFNGCSGWFEELGY